MFGQRTPLILWALFFASIGTAHATSSVRGLPRKGICEVAARYLGSELKDGHVVWKFVRTQPSRSTECVKLTETFAAWVWSGSYSSLSNTFVYPVNLNEPKLNSSVKVKIEYRIVRESRGRNQPAAPVAGWFLEGSLE